MKNLITMSMVWAVLGIFLVPAISFAGECSSGLCGTPDQSGGACGGCGCGSILVAMTDRGDTYQFGDDVDGDGYENGYDNCPFVSNFEQVNSDGDNSGDACDNCPGVANNNQYDADGDRIGDACDPDIDGDGVDDVDDNCPMVSNANQTNTDLELQKNPDKLGDACDDDDDGDGFADSIDLCRLIPDTNQNQTTPANTSKCDSDFDSDGHNDDDDNCPEISNPKQTDTDSDGVGDVCDMDKDNDGFANWQDNCPMDINKDQADLDRDGLGDLCDTRVCYVVDEGTCLDPNAAFNIEAVVANARIKGDMATGNKMTLNVLSNRPGDEHQWKASFRKMPEGSKATFDNKIGSGKTLAGFPQVANCVQQASDGSCDRFNQISFTPDEPGTYEVRVEMTLPNGDPKSLGSSTAVAMVVANIGGESTSGGCAASSTSLLTGLALGMLALVRRRRRQG